MPALITKIQQKAPLQQLIKTPIANSSKSGGIGLPLHKKTPEKNLLKYTGLIYGREKIGKTTVLTSFPETIFAMTEPGSKGLEIYEYNSDNGGITDWKIFLSMVNDLCADSTHRFKNVVIDTADRLYDMALTYTCNRLGIEYPGVDEDGKNDYGKSWNAIATEFTRAIDRLAKANYGIWFTSHCKEEEFKNKLTKDSYTRIFPSMSKQARKVVEALVDFFFYADYVTELGTNKQLRVCITQGDEVIWAGNRKTPHGTLPLYIPMSDDGTFFDTIQNAFLGENVGVEPARIIPTRSASEPLKDFIKKSKKPLLPPLQKKG